jgi:hypothetical protein
MERTVQVVNGMVGMAGAGVNPELQEILAKKQARRQWLAALPFPEKMRIVIRLQATAAPIQRAKGRAGRAWALHGN